MPRERTVTMGKITPQESHEAAIKKTIKRNRPYEVTEGALVNRDPGQYAVVYRAPRGGDRKVVATRNVKANAAALRDLLNEAWAEGYSASGFID